VQNDFECKTMAYRHAHPEATCSNRSSHCSYCEVFSHRIAARSAVALWLGVWCVMACVFGVCHMRCVWCAWRMWSAWCAHHCVLWYVFRCTQTRAHARTHTHTQTHTKHTHTHQISLTLALSHARALTHSLSLFHTHIHTQAYTRTHMHTRTHTWQTHTHIPLSH